MLSRGKKNWREELERGKREAVKMVYGQNLMSGDTTDEKPQVTEDEKKKNS